MKRLPDAQETMSNLYRDFVESAEMRLPALDVSNAESLTVLLDRLAKLEAKIGTKSRKAMDLNAKLKASIADVLLLLDGFDIKNKGVQKESSNVLENSF